MHNDLINSCSLTVNSLPVVPNTLVHIEVCGRAVF